MANSQRNVPNDSRNPDNRNMLYGIIAILIIIAIVYFLFMREPVTTAPGTPTTTPATTVGTRTPPTSANTTPTNTGRETSPNTY